MTPRAACIAAGEDAEAETTVGCDPSSAWSCRARGGRGCPRPRPCPGRFPAPARGPAPRTAAARLGSAPADSERIEHIRVGEPTGETRRPIAGRLQGCLEARSICRVEVSAKSQHANSGAPARPGGGGSGLGALRAAVVIGLGSDRSRSARSAAASSAMSSWRRWARGLGGGLLPVGGQQPVAACASGAESAASVSTMGERSASAGTCRVLVYERAASIRRRLPASATRAASTASPAAWGGGALRAGAPPPRLAAAGRCQGASEWLAWSIACCTRRSSAARWREAASMRPRGRSGRNRTGRWVGVGQVR